MDLLKPIEVRVLGALIEKAVTTPDYYPLSLNALTSACNQSSNRDPVVDYDERAVAAAIDSLRAKNLVRIVDRGASRVPRHRHVADETWGLDAAQLAVMDVLMLRGPSTVGEIRTRCGRLHNFHSLDEVGATLDALAVRAPDPFVARLPRQKGHKEVRYVHRLSAEGMPEPEDFQSAGPPSLDERLAQLEQTTADLRSQVEDLRQEFELFRKEFQ